MGKFKKMMEVTSNAGYSADEGEPDTITLRPSYSSTKEFYITILHEIQHAKDAYRLGVAKFMKKYTQAGTVAAYDGLDPHDDNKWEERAERFARSEVRKYI